MSEFMGSVSDTASPEELTAEMERLREWSHFAFNFINRIKPANAADANEQAGLLTAYPKDMSSYPEYSGPLGSPTCPCGCKGNAEEHDDGDAERG